MFNYLFISYTIKNKRKMKFPKLNKFMQNLSNYVSILIAMSAFVLSLSIYNRESKKNNEDILYQEKINSYQNIASALWKHYSNTFEYIELVQGKVDFKSSEVMEVVKIHEEFEIKLNVMKVRNSTVIPNNVIYALNQYLNISEKLQVECINRVLAEDFGNYQYNQPLFKDYDELGSHVNSIINLMREDLKTEALNVSLFERLE